MTAELMTILAHDVRNHLTPMRLRAQLIRARAMRDRRAVDAADGDALDGSIKRLERLVADVLDVARIERGLFALAPDRVDLGRVAREVAESLETPDVPVVVRADAPEATAFGDPDRLRQALENLVANAVRHSPPGSRVVVEIDRIAHDDDPRVEARVTDDGPGVPPQVLGRMFEPFVTGPGSGGLGLGLYLARQVALSHGGDLRVEQAAVGGASFVLSLPVERRDGRP